MLKLWSSQQQKEQGSESCIKDNQATWSFKYPGDSLSIVDYYNDNTASMPSSVCLNYFASREIKINPNFLMQELFANYLNLPQLPK